MTDISKQSFCKALYKAVLKTYYVEIVKATPGKGIVADGWDVELESDGVSIVNREFGNIVKFLEDGTKEYDIEPKNKKALAFGKTLGAAPGGGPMKEFVYKKVHHPGIKARLFINKVLESGAVRKSFEKELESEIKKLLI